MIVSSLTLAQFRRFSYRECSFPPGLTFITGPNGTGKTTLLEAIHYLSRGRSFRTHRDRRCIQHNRSGFSLNGRLTNETERTIGLAYEQSGSGRKKVARVDGEILSRLSALQGILPTVLFTPDKTRLITGSPDRRRTYLDDLASQFRSQYLEQLQQYETTRSQRNQLLKGSSVDKTLLSEYDRALVRSGEPLIKARSDLLSRLEPHLNRVLTELGSPWGKVELRYRPDVEAGELAAGLKKKRGRDLNAGFTTVGPHRDDWRVLCDGHRADQFASRGERRLLVISLKFAESNAILESYERLPVLLLDDLESELDEGLVEACLAWCQESPCQVLITGTKLDSSYDVNPAHRMRLGG